MVVELAGVSATVVLASLSGLHLYWAAGGRVGAAAAVPTVDGRPRLTPSTRATLVVAFLLGMSAVLLLGGAERWAPQVLFRVGAGGIGIVLLARAIGERRSVGFLKRVRGTAFAAARHLAVLAGVPRPRGGGAGRRRRGLTV